MIIELINRPVSLLVCLFLLLVLIFFKGKVNKKCHYCKKGKMRIVEKTPIGVDHLDFNHKTGGTHENRSIIRVRMKVIYKCDQCGEFNENIENN